MQLGVGLVGLACLVMACTPAQTRTDSQASRAPAPTTSTALEAGPGVSDTSEASPAAAAAPPPAASSASAEAIPADVGPIAQSQVPSGLEAVRSCLQYFGELRLAPKPAFQAKSARALATKLGFRARRTPSLEAFCEPELRPKICAYADCSVPGFAFAWQMAKPRDGDGATALLVIEDTAGQANAYRVGEVELWEPEFACGCMAASEFARVTRPQPDVVVVAYFAQTRPGRMCAEAYSTSTWFLDDALHPVAAVVSYENDGPTAVEVQRSADQILVRIQGRCEAVVAWPELEAAAIGEAQR